MVTNHVRNVMNEVIRACREDAQAVEDRATKRTIDSTRIFINLRVNMDAVVVTLFETFSPSIKFL